MVFWKMTWLPAGNHQGTESGSPYLTGDYEGGIAGQTGTMTGYASRADFTRLRYYEGRWEFYLDAELDAWDTGAKWGKDKNGDGVITAEESQGWYPVNPTEAERTELNMSDIAAGDGQIVAYYLQVTDATREVITNVADWGPAIDDSRNIGYGKDYVLLDFAVRYEDGVRNPNETGTFPIPRAATIPPERSTPPTRPWAFTARKTGAMLRSGTMAPCGARSTPSWPPRTRSTATRST